jgi:hypothetical protein
MKKFFIISLIFLLNSCVGPAGFVGENMFAMVGAKTAEQAAASYATSHVTDQISINQTGKTKAELLASEVTKKDCKREDLTTITCK